MEKQEKTTENNNTFQQGYVAYYKSTKFLKNLRRLPIKVTYVSRKQNAIFFYTDYRFEERLLSQLKRVKGFESLEKAPLFQEETNF